MELNSPTMKETSDHKTPEGTCSNINEDTSAEITEKKKGENWVSKILASKLLARVNKPLIPLKVALFFFFGAEGAIIPFIQVYAYQKGLSIAQVSFIYMLLPLFLFLETAGAGIIADKIGRSKPVLLGNMILCLVSLNSMLFIPSIKDANCPKDVITMTCCPNPIINGLETCHDTMPEYRERQCSFDEVYDGCKCLDDLFCNGTSNSKTFPYNFTFSTHPLSWNISKVLCYANASFFQKDKFHFCENFKSPKCNLTYLEPNLKITITTCSDEFYDNSTFVFYMLLVVLVIFHTASSICYQVFAFTSMSLVTTHNSDYGRQRFWCILGFMIFSLFSAYEVNNTTKEANFENYNTAIYVYDFLNALSMLAICKLDVQVQPPSKHMIKKCLSLLKNPDVAAFLIAVLILGTCLCFERQYLNLYLDSLGGPSLLLGLNTSLNSLFGLPFLFTSNYFMDKIGSTNILVLGLAGHTVLFVGYAYLIDPWWSVIFELTGILTYHLLWVAVTRHSHDIAQEGFKATAVSISDSVHFGIGRGTGSLIGGLTMSKYGARIAFKLMATISGSAGIMYAFYLFLRDFYSKRCLKISSSDKDQVKGNSYVKTEPTVYYINMAFPTISK